MFFTVTNDTQYLSFKPSVIVQFSNIKYKVNLLITTIIVHHCPYQKTLRYPLKNNSPHHSFQPLVISILLYVSLNLPVPALWNRNGDTRHLSFCVSLLSQQEVFGAHPRGSVCGSFIPFLRLNRMPLCENSPCWLTYPLPIAARISQLSMFKNT